MFLSRILRRSVPLVPQHVRCKMQGTMAEASAFPLEMEPAPEYLAERIAMFDHLKAVYDASLAGRRSDPIKITLPDGRVVDGQSWRSTPHEIASLISPGLAQKSVVAKVNGELWDLDRPLQGDATLELLKFEDEEGKQVFWHSSAHILGEALERHYGGLLCYGPPIKSGFYYDMHMTDRTVLPSDHAALEILIKEICREKQPFVRIEVAKEDLRQMFHYNPFKLHIINERVTTPTTTVYRCGTLVDLCLGPHVRHTGNIKAMAVTNNSSSKWEGSGDAKYLQRVHGISFPDTKQLKEWRHFQEEAAKRDHRKIGADQELFFFHHHSPGSCFFFPKGTHIYNILLDFIRSEYRRRGYQEVKSPNIYNSKLFEKSGHWEHYAENIFAIKLENETYGLKPMNCPGHCLMFDQVERSHRELPLRFADFGALHRNEISGALSGLTRVRRFQQDDAHIFCTMEQIEDEIRGCLEFLEHVYGVLGFTFDLYLSTRPESYLGDAAVWDIAESQLKSSLVSFCGDAWKLNPGDGAFYGPKIDVVLKDALRREHQCATIQLDFQLPERFNLTYQSATQEQDRPVMIHRAVLGSVERMIAVLAESFGGKWPFWLSPRQVTVVPVDPKFYDFAVKVADRCRDEGFCADADVNNDSMNRKVRKAQLAQFNYILVVGQKEVDGNTVNVRTRNNQILGEFGLDDFVARCQQLTASRSNDSSSAFPVDAAAA